MSWRLPLALEGAEGERRGSAASIEGCGGAAGPSASSSSAQRPERGPELAGEQLRLLPGGEMAAALGFAKVDQVAEGAPCPAFRGAIDFVRKDGDGHRHGDFGRP